MRTTVAENARLGALIAEKLNRARGPTIFVLPKKGVSLIDTEGKPFYDPEADAAFAEALKANLAPQVKLVEIDTHINDERFATAAANLLLELLQR